MSEVTILDTSWVLELYQVPGDSKKTRHAEVLRRTSVAARGGLFVTLPVLFEVANHIVHVRDGNVRRRLVSRFRCDLKRSLEEDVPWIVVTSMDDGILLRSEDLIALSDRFLQESGPGYSFADISVIDLATELRRKIRTVKVRILAFDEQLRSYSD